MASQLLFSGLGDAVLSPHVAYAVVSLKLTMQVGRPPRKGFVAIKSFLQRIVKSVNRALSKLRLFQTSRSI
jgi:hypothetical protein